MLSALDAVFDSPRSDRVLTDRDTNSTRAAALSPVKCTYLWRDFRRLEELQRSHAGVTQPRPDRHTADHLLAPTELAARQLGRESHAGRAVLVGDVMTDALYEVRNHARIALIRTSSRRQLPMQSGSRKDR